MSVFEDNLRLTVSKLEEEISSLKESAKCRCSDYEKAKSLLLCAKILLRDSVCPSNQVQIEWMSRRAAFNLEVSSLK